MNAINLGYSLKNIPIPPNNVYLKCLVDKIENFVRRLRWKAFFFEKSTNDATFNNNNDNNVFKQESHGFKSLKTPPQNELLNPFENDLYDIMRNIEFKHRKNQFQSKMKQDLQNIKSSDNLFVPADKTTNMYEMPKDNYNKLLKENITKNYKKCDKSIKNSYR